MKCFPTLQFLQVNLMYCKKYYHLELLFLDILVGRRIGISNELGFRYSRKVLAYFNVSKFDRSILTLIWVGDVGREFYLPPPPAVGFPIITQKW